MKIEKLEKNPPEYRCKYVSELTEKINELIDKLNEHENRLNSQLKWLGELRDQSIPKEEKEPRILPCPICQEQPTVTILAPFDEDSKEEGMRIDCEHGDLCIVAISETKQEAIEAWNKRA